LDFDQPARRGKPDRYRGEQAAEYRDPKSDRVAVGGIVERSGQPRSDGAPPIEANINVPKIVP
jgi:hypothetical protein